MSEPVPFATNAWIERLGEVCNQSEAYREAAKSWEGDFYMIVEVGGSLKEPVYMYIDLYHGRCRQAVVADDPGAFNPEFRISGPVRAWQEVSEKNIDPIKALITRKLTLKGNMAKIMRHARAAQALMKCAVSFETEFPT